MRKFRLLAILAALALLLVYAAAALRSGDFTVESARLIDAPPKQVMPYIDNFHGWAGWWPPERQDPGIVRRFGARASGLGASYQWTTGGLAGTGRMTIVEERPDLLRIRIDQAAPVPHTAELEFRLTAVEDGTRITMRYAGTNDLRARLRHPLGISTEPLEMQLDDALTYLKMVIEGTEPV